MGKPATLKGLPKRIQKEIQRLGKDAPPGISIAPHNDNYRYFNIVIAGPQDTPYEGGIFKLEMFLTKEYPMKPPKTRFLTRIYHPNVDKLGRICLDVLKDKWSPALQSAPTPDDPLDNGVADAWNRDEAAAQRTAAE